LRRVGFLQSSIHSFHVHSLEEPGSVNHRRDPYEGRTGSSYE
jgi:hypothetical protein